MSEVLFPLGPTQVKVTASVLPVGKDTGVPGAGGGISGGLSCSMAAKSVTVIKLYSLVKFSVEVTDEVRSDTMISTSLPAL